MRPRGRSSTAAAAGTQGHTQAPIRPACPMRTSWRSTTAMVAREGALLRPSGRWRASTRVTTRAAGEQLERLMAVIGACLAVCGWWGTCVLVTDADRPGGRLQKLDEIDSFKLYAPVRSDVCPCLCWPGARARLLLTRVFIGVAPRRSGSKPGRKRQKRDTPDRHSPPGQAHLAGGGEAGMAGVNGGARGGPGGPCGGPLQLDPLVGYKVQRFWPQVRRSSDGLVPSQG